MERYVKVLLVVTIIVVIFGATLFMYSTLSKEEKEFVVYVPSEWMYGLEPEDKEVAYNYIFSLWGEKHNIKVRPMEFDTETAMADQIVKEVTSGNTIASVAILPLSIYLTLNKSELFEKYISSQADLIDERLKDIVGYDGYGTPIDWCPLSFVYDSKYLNITNVSLMDFVRNRTLAKQLYFVNPTGDEPGPQWLLSVIAYYRVAGLNNWTEWFSSLKEELFFTSWDAMYEYVESGETERHFMTGYFTDAIEMNWDTESRDYKFEFLYYNGSYYAWMIVEVAVILKNNPYLELSKDFIDWLLSEPVQRWAPIYNGFIPANKLTLDEVPRAFFEYGTDVSKVKPLNVYISNDELRENLDDWITEWHNAISS